MTATTRKQTPYLPTQPLAPTQQCSPDALNPSFGSGYHLAFKTWPWQSTFAYFVTR